MAIPNAKLIVQLFNDTHSHLEVMSFLIRDAEKARAA